MQFRGRTPSAIRYGEGFYKLWWFCETFTQKRELIKYWRSRPKVQWP